MARTVVVRSEDVGVLWCVACPFHNGEWSTCQVVPDSTELTCPEVIDDDNCGYAARIPSACPLHAGPITVTLNEQG